MVGEFCCVAGSLERLDKGTGLSRGVPAFDLADPVSGEQEAVFDLARPHNIQGETRQPVAVLFNEDPETVGVARKAGLQCFTTTQDFVKK